MKKLFCFLAIAATAAFTSCSSDDDSGNTDNPGTGDVVTGITLTSSASSVTLGDAFVFTVKNNLNEDVTSSSTIYVNDAAITGSSFTPDAIGSYTVHATNGEFTSADVTVSVTEEVIVVTSLDVTYDVQIVNTGETITFTATANETMDVTADATFMVDGEAIEGNTFSSETPGVFEITATYEGFTSEEETVYVAVVGPAVTFTADDVNNSAILYFGRYTLDAGGYVDYFSIVSYEGTDAYSDLTATDNYLDVEVLVQVEEGDDVTLPSGDNASFYQIYQFIKDGVGYPIVSIESGSVTGVTEGLTAASETAAFNIQAGFNGDYNASTIDLDYDGAFDTYYDYSSAGRGTNMTLEAARAARAKFMSK